MRKKRFKIIMMIRATILHFTHSLYHTTGVENQHIFIHMPFLDVYKEGSVISMVLNALVAPSSWWIVG